EQRYRTLGAGGVQVHDLVGDVQVVGEPLVHPLVDLTDHRGRYGGAVPEVEPQPGGSVLRTGLGRLLAEELVQRLVHHVRGSVRTGDRVPAVGVDLGDRHLVQGDAALGEAPTVHVQSVDR